MITQSELERAAYISGQTTLAQLHGIADDWQTVDDALDTDIPMDRSIQDAIDARIDAAVTNRCPDYDAYKQFFEDCFAHLLPDGGHYPCPSVTSDYDCSVIFDAIAKGDGMGS